MNSAGALRFGGNSVWSEWFSGQLDEIRIYDRALTQAELQADMTTPVTCTGGRRRSPALSVSKTHACRSRPPQGGANPAPQTFDVTNTGGGTLNFTASESASWLRVSPASGTAPAHRDRHALDRRPRPGHLHGAGHGRPPPGATGSPKTVDVTLTVNPADPGAGGGAGEPVVHAPRRAARTRRRRP